MTLPRDRFRFCFRHLPCWLVGLFLVVVAAGWGCSERRDDHRQEFNRPELATAPSDKLGSAPAPAETTPGRCDRQGVQHVVARGVASASGPIALARWGERDVLLVADEDESAVHVVSRNSLELIKTVVLSAAPAHVLVTQQGLVLLSLRHANRVALLQPGADIEDGLTEVCSDAVTREPIALAQRAKTSEFVVLGASGAELAVLSHRTLHVTKRAALSREPRGVLIHEDIAWVSHMVGGVVSAVRLADMDVQVVETKRLAAKDASSRSTHGFGLALFHDHGGDSRILVPQVHSRPPDPERERLERYYGDSRAFRPWVAAVDTTTKKPVAQTHEELGPNAWPHTCLLPQAATSLGDRLWVACLDNNTVLEVDARLPDPMLGVYRQYHVGAGPSGLAMGKDRSLFVWSLFDHTLSRISVPQLDDRPLKDVPPASAVTLDIPRRANTAWPAARAEGRILFHTRDDTRISVNGASCAGCHPDGRDDGLTWSGAQTTIYLAGRLEGTAPYGWLGHQETVAKRIESTITRMSGTGFWKKAQRPEFEHLVAYVQSLPTAPPPLPHRQEQAQAIERGKHIFTSEMDCASCHPGGGSSGAKLSVDGTPFDAPSLAYVADSAPYFHDNRYATLEALLSDPKDPMDATSSLTPEQVTDLAAYVTSLPYGAVKEVPDVGALVRHEARVFAKAKSPRPRKRVTVHPGRYLAAKPRLIELSSIPSFDMPADMHRAQSENTAVLMLAEADKTLRGGVGTTSIGGPEGTDFKRLLVPAYVIYGNREPLLEVRMCTPKGSPLHHYWQEDAWSQTFDCTQPGVSTPTFDLGYGRGAVTTIDGKLTLLVAATDAWQRDVMGPIVDIGTTGRIWMDLHAIRLKRGSAASLSRAGADTYFWPLPAHQLGAIIVNWPRHATSPTIMSASYTREDIFSKQLAQR